MKCVRCGHRWDGDTIKCPKCSKWNANTRASDNERIVRLSEVSASEEDRIITNLCDKVFGGGIVRTSATLIGGSPGAGKSTLMLQLCNVFTYELNTNVLYVAAEEEPGQIKSRANRLGVKNQDKIHVLNALGEVDKIEDILAEIDLILGLVIVDSLPGLCGENDAKAIATCKALKEYASQKIVPIIIIDHITKESEFAGRMTLQHAVDTLISFYPDEKTGKRVLKTHKNRHGPAFVSNTFDMTENGLVPTLELDGSTLPPPNEPSALRDTSSLGF